MPAPLQPFLVGLTHKAMTDLADALDRIPAGKRNWKPAEKSRSALDQVAECAVLNGFTAMVLEALAWPEEARMQYPAAKEALVAQGSDAVLARLRESTPRVLTAIGSLPDEEIDREIATPFGPATFGQIAVYPYWNMSYHLGQINYIASMLEAA